MALLSNLKQSASNRYSRYAPWEPETRWVYRCDEEPIVSTLENETKRNMEAFLVMSCQNMWQKHEDDPSPVKPGSFSTELTPKITEIALSSK